MTIYDFFNIISKKLMKINICLFLFGLMFLSLNVNAQQPSYFLFAEKQFEGADIYDIIQDHELNYWISTDQGIYKHDGYSFKKIECEEMKSSSVFNFIIDKRGNIYCNNLNLQIFLIKNDKCSLYIDLTSFKLRNDVALKLTENDNLLVYSNKAFVFDKYKRIISSSKHISEALLSPAFEMKDKSILIHKSSFDESIYYKNGKFSSIKIKCDIKKNPISILDFFRFNNGKSIAIDRVFKKIYEFDEKKIELKYIKKIPDVLANEYLRYYMCKNQLWIAGSISGTVVYDENLNLIYGENKIFQEFFVSDIVKDHEGNVLVGTFDKGILVIPNLEIPDVINALKDYEISRISSDDKGTMFFGTSKGGILAFRNGKPNEIYKNGVKVIETLHYWKGKSLLLFDELGVTYYNVLTKQLFQKNIGSMKDIFEQDSNTLFIALNVGVLKLVYNSNNQKFEYVFIKKLEGRTSAISGERKTKNIYIATNEGLKILDKNGDVSFMEIGGKKVQAKDFTKVKDTVIAATRKNGIIFLYNGKLIKQIFPIFNNENVEVYQLQYQHGRIYVNSNFGLMVLTLKGEIVQLVNNSIGVSANRIIDFYVDQNDIWIAQARGVQRIKLNNLRKSKEKPKVFIASVKVNNFLIDAVKSDFSPQQRKISFSLFVPTLKNRENIRYHYKLVGNDDAWNSAPYEENMVTYNALGPGVYTFMVRAENNGLYGKTIKYTFSIAAPFYQTWWFITSVIVLGFLLITWIYRIKLKNQNKKSAQINELNASKLTAIQSQMNPHFIFNSLNSIQDLVLKGDIDNSYTFITKFSNLVRKTLNYSEKDFIEFEQELDLIKLYLTLEKLRFKDNLNYSIEIEEMEDIQIPPMLIQPFIENALLHGLLHKEGEKNLLIKFYLNENLVCEIIDNGIGRKRSKEIKERQKSEHESFAIQAIKKRFSILQTQFKDAIGFSYEDLEKDGAAMGTKVILHLPIKQRF